MQRTFLLFVPYANKIYKRQVVFYDLGVQVIVSTRAPGKAGYVEAALRAGEPPSTDVHSPRGPHQLVKAQHETKRTNRHRCMTVDRSVRACLFATPSPSLNAEIFWVRISP